jgi:hypothetical protein
VQTADLISNFGHSLSSAAKQAILQGAVSNSKELAFSMQEQEKGLNSFPVLATLPLLSAMRV